MASPTTEPRRPSIRFDCTKGQIFAAGFVAVAQAAAARQLSPPTARGPWSAMYKIDGGAPRPGAVPQRGDLHKYRRQRAIDSNAGIIYAQILTAPHPRLLDFRQWHGHRPYGPAGTTSSTPAATAPPVLSILDADNLTVRQSLVLPENMTGRAMLTSAADVLYTVSDSGVMVLPVGSLNQYPPPGRRAGATWW